MSRSILVAVTLSAAFASPSFADTQTLKLAPFSAIKANAAMNVVWQSGPSVSGRLETTDADFSDANITVDGDTLIVSRNSIKKRGWFHWGSSSVEVLDDGKTVKVNGKSVPLYTLLVTSPSLHEAHVTQASRLDASGIDADRFSANASSQGAMVLAGRAGETTLSASSNGSLDASGLDTGKLRADVSSAGLIAATTNGTGEVSINVSSSGDAKITSVEPAIFTIDASSGADVEVGGKCSRMNATASSGADIKAQALACSTIQLNASSGAEIEASASEEVQATASSGSDITIHGNPLTRGVFKSSGGEVKFVD